MTIVVPFKQIDGSVKYKVGEQLLNQDDYTAARTYLGGVTTVNPSAEEELADITRQFEGKLENDFVASGAELDETAYNKLVNDSQIEAKRFLGLEAQPAVIKENKPKSRMALAKPRKMGSKDLEEITKPWSEVTRTITSPDYVGYDEQSWRRNNDETLQGLKRRRGSSNKELSAYLQSRGFGDIKDRDRVLKKFKQNPRQSILHTEFINGPMGAADEDLAIALMQGVGFKPVTTANDVSATGTDIQAYVQGTPFKVDAQSRTGKLNRKDGGADLNLGVVKSWDNNNPVDWREILNNNPDEPVMSLIKRQLDAGVSLGTDKLLDTSDIGFNPIEGGKDFDSTRQKDLIISSNRPNVGKRNRTGKTAGPYDRILPEGWDLLDLEMAREQLLGLSINQLRDKGLGLQGSNGSLRMRIPTSFIRSNLTNPDMRMAGDIINQLSRPIRRI